jgi:hypothetical protein
VTAQGGDQPPAIDTWEVANGWTVEPEHARRRLAELRRRLGDDGRRHDLDAGERP